MKTVIMIIRFVTRNDNLTIYNIFDIRFYRLRVIIRVDQNIIYYPIKLCTQTVYIYIYRYQK